MKVTFLGTTGMIPTAQRNHSAILFTYRDENILIDCGEGTQRQLRIAGIPPPKITRIFITHWHGDHFFGLPGMIENLSKNHYHKTLELYGPTGTKKTVEKILDAMLLTNKLSINVHDITKDGVFLETETFALISATLKHSTPCRGFRFQEKDMRKINLDYLNKHHLPEGPILRKLQQGKTIHLGTKVIKAKDATFIKKGKVVTFLIDTLPTKNCVALAKDADLLVCDSTFHSELTDKAEEYYHLTSAQAAHIAKKAKAKKLVLTHFSQRYKDITALEAEAKNIFPSTTSAYDFLTIEV